MAKKGKFVVFEGGEGSGKDANIELLWQKVATRRDIVFTREPGGTRIGEKIRAILMDPAHAHMSVETELLLFLASRAQLLEEVVRPALERGQHVISNRFALSTVAYQIYRKNRHEYRDFLETVSAELMSDIEPYYILMDVPPEVGLARARGRDEAATRFDLETLEMHERVRTGYHDAVQDHPHIIVDATQPLAAVHEQVHAHVLEILSS